MKLNKLLKQSTKEAIKIFGNLGYQNDKGELIMLVDLMEKYITKAYVEGKKEVGKQKFLEASKSGIF